MGRSYSIETVLFDEAAARLEHRLSPVENLQIMAYVGIIERLEYLIDTQDAVVKALHNVGSAIRAGNGSPRRREA